VYHERSVDKLAAVTADQEVRVDYSMTWLNDFFLENYS
jgi:hypothetical protein